jgi:hypothetical protein
MTPVNIKRLRLQKKEKQEAIRALKQAKRDDKKRERKRSDSKRNYEKRQVPENKQKSSGGSILM